MLVVSNTSVVAGDLVVDSYTEEYEVEKNYSPIVVKF